MNDMDILRKAYERENDTRDRRPPEHRNKVITCRYCIHEPFPDYKELAKHVIKFSKTHRGGVMWAKKFLTNDKYLNKKLAKKEALKKMGQMPAATEEQIDTLARTRRELSGKTEMVTTICLDGKHAVAQLLPIEFTQSPTAFKIQGYLPVKCAQHRNKNGGGHK